MEACKEELITKLENMKEFCKGEEYSFVTVAFHQEEVDALIDALTKGYQDWRKDAVVDILELAHCRAEWCTMDGFCDACIDCIINPADIFYHEKIHRPFGKR